MKLRQFFSRFERKLLFLLSYFFVYKTGFISFQNNFKDLDPSYNLAFWDCLAETTKCISELHKTWFYKYAVILEG